MKIDKQAELLAESTGVRIFSPRPENMTIYNLFDDFSEYQADCLEQRRSTGGKAVFPVAMKIETVIRDRDPLLLGCKIIRGQLRVGTPIVVAKMVGGMAAPFDLGTVESIQIEGQAVHEATTGQTVAVKFNSGNIKPKPMFKRHFDMQHQLVSRISRATIEELKANYRDQMVPDDWALIRDYLKSYFGIP